MSDTFGKGRGGISCHHQLSVICTAEAEIAVEWTMSGVRPAVSSSRCEGTVSSVFVPLEDIDTD